MTYLRACGIHNVNPKNVERNKAIGKSLLGTLVLRCPLRYKVAAKVLIAGHDL